MYGYNPYGNGAPAMQSRLSALDQQYYRPQMSSTLNGRIVTGVEEARASQIPLDGTVSYFPSPAENKIYTKGIDMQGMPYIQVYVAQQPVTQENNIQQLDARLTAIEAKIKEMTSHEPNANAGNAQ